MLTSLVCVVQRQISKIENARRYLGILALLSFLPLALNGITINISAGVPNGGFGDVASNLLMAYQLQKTLPKDEIRFVVNESARSILIVLLPSLKEALQAGRAVIIDGIEFIPPEMKIPGADLALQFSGPPMSNDITIRAQGLNAKFAIEFSEYSHEKRMLEKNFWGRSQIEALTVKLPTGANSRKLYLSPTPSEPMPRAKLIGELVAELRPEVSTRSDEEKFIRKMASLVDGVSSLAFCYAGDPAICSDYVDALAKLKEFGHISGDVVVFKKATFTTADEVKPGLFVVSYLHIPFALSQGLIGNADLMPLVTGDVSLSLALDYEQPFLYEKNSWKNEFARSLLRTIVSDSSFDRFKPSSRHSVKELDFPAHLSERTESRRERVERMLRIIRDKGLHEKMRQRMGQMRAEYSLPKALAAFIKNGEYSTKACVQFLRNISP